MDWLVVISGPMRQGMVNSDHIVVVLAVLEVVLFLLGFPLFLLFQEDSGNDPVDLMHEATVPLGPPSEPVRNLREASKVRLGP